MEKSQSLFFEEFYKGNFLSKAKPTDFIVHLLLLCTWYKEKKEICQLAW